jgi:hypothetical protein
MAPRLVTVNVRPKDGGGLKMSSAAHLRHLEQVVKEYGEVIDGANALISIKMDSAAPGAANLEREVKAACRSFFTHGDRVKVKH